MKRRPIDSAPSMLNVSLTPEQEDGLAELKARHASRVRAVRLFTDTLPELTYTARPERRICSEKEDVLEPVVARTPATHSGAENVHGDLKRRELIERRFLRRHARRGHAAAKGPASGKPVDYHALDRMNYGRCSSFSAEERNAFRGLCLYR